MRPIGFSTGNSISCVDVKQEKKYEEEEGAQGVDILRRHLVVLPGATAFSF
jgi:hypothetical protein